MTVELLIEDLRQRGVELWCEGENLRFRAPPGALDGALRARLVAGKAEVIAALRGAAAARSVTAPASYNQRSLWMVQQEDPESSAYHVAFVARVVSEVDVAALRRALQALIDRHAILRTTYGMEDAALTQRIAGHADVDLTLRTLPGADDAELDRHLKAEYSRPFDLATGPVFRSALFSRAPTDHVLLLVVHHIAADGWSLFQLLDELRALYAEQTGRAPAALPRPKADYGEYATWQANMLRGAEGSSIADYWLRQLQEPRAELELPADRRRPPRKSGRGASLSFELDTNLSSSARNLARAEGTTLFVVLLAVYKVLLYRLSGTADVLVGTPTFGRNRPEFARTVGDFVNTIVLRTMVDGRLPFRDFLAEVKKVQLEALSAQDYPFQLLVQRLQPVRNAARAPLVETLFVLQRFDQLRDLEPVLVPDGTTDSIDFGGLTLRHYALDQQEGQFDLTLQMIDASKALIAQLKYNQDLFDASTIQRFAGHFRQLLRAIVADPSSSIDSLAMHTALQRSALIKTGGSVVAANADCMPLHLRFELQANRSPESIAVGTPDQRLTYKELNRRANRLAHRLIELGVGPDCLVGLRVDRSIELAVGLLGILKASGAYLPIDLTYPADRVAFMLDDSKAGVLLTHSNLRDGVGQYSGSVVLLDDGNDEYPECNPAPRVGPDNLIYSIYTSGSTGRPKGTLLTHRAVDRLFSATEHWFEFDARDVWSMFHSIAFDFSVWEIWGAWRHGGRLLIVPHWVSRAPDAFLDLLRQEGVTVLNQTPSAFRQLLHADLVGGEPQALSLRFVIFGGEALELQSLRPWFARYGDRRPKLVNMYGITETCVHVTYRPISLADLDAGCGSVIGGPIPDLRVHVLDACREPQPIGVLGEMYVGGPGLAVGYLNRPDLTAECFVPDPFVPGERLYRSGDLARRLPNGDLEYFGRIDLQVKIRGFRIELGEIESAIAKSGLAREAAVLDRDDALGNKQLVAFVVADDTSDRTHQRLRECLKQTLPDYMVPASFVFLAVLPLTSNGKADRRALLAMSTASAPSQRTVDLPRNPTEELIAALWCELLGVPEVSRNDNFFELGGHSLLVARVGGRLSAAFGVRVRLRALFELSTIGSLAKHIDDLRKGETSDTSIPVAVRSPRPPLSFSQQRLWFFHQLEPQSALFNLPIALRLNGALDRAALAGSIGVVAARHESLRTSFPVAADEPFQSVIAELAIQVPFLDLSLHAVRARDDRLRAEVAAEANTPFNLADGPLLRARLVRIAEREHVLLITFHHAIADGVSIGIFLRDWAESYRASVVREAPDLAPLPIQYVDYSIWQRTWLSGERLGAHLDYWRHALEGAPPHLELATDLPRPALQTYSGGVCQRPIPHALRAQLETLSARANATLFMTMFAAFVQLLARQSGQDDVSVGLAVAGRVSADTENLVGLFINTLVLRARLRPEMSFGELLSDVRKSALDAYDHQGLPFEKLVEELRPPRDPSRSPLFQVLFNMLDVDLPTSMQLPGLEVTPFGDASGVKFRAKFDLTLYVLDWQGSMALTAVYNTDLFLAERIEDLLEQYLGVLSSATESPTRPIREFSLLTASAARLLPDPSAALAFSWEGSIQSAFTRHARSAATRVAIADVNGALTYGELEVLSNQLANHLIALGVQREETVVVRAYRNIGLAWALLGILKAGAAFVIVDASYPAERLAANLVVASPKAFIDLGDAALPPALQAQLDAMPPSHRIAWQGEMAAAWRHSSAAAPADASRPSDLAYLVFTSGSTGTPKAIAGTHAPLSHFFAWHQATWGLAPEDRFSVLSGLSHDPLLRDMLGALWVGATIVMPDASRFGAPGYLGDWLRRERISVMHLTPAMADLLSIGEHEGANVGNALPDLRHVFFGGDALSFGTVSSLRRRAPLAQYVNFYGASETPQAMAFQRVLDDAGAHPSQRVPLGRGISGVQILVLNDAGQLAGIGEFGEICIRTPYLARGYVGHPELTAARFTTNAATGAPADRIYRTGDCGRYRADGSVDYHGRRDAQVKIRGFRVELGDVAAGLQAHDAVAESAAALKVAEGQEARLVAYYVVEPGVPPPEPDALRAFMQGRLPDYMVPSVFVALERLPLTPNGKLDVARLPLPSIQPGRQRTSPRNDVESTIAGIWRDVLGTEAFGVEDNFFELGGQSLKATRVLSRLRAQLNVEVPLRDLFESPTIASLAMRIEAAQTQYGGGAGAQREEMVF